MKIYIFPIIVLILLVNSCSRMIVKVSTADLKTVTKATDPMINRIHAFKYSAARVEFFSNRLFDEKELNKIFGNAVKEGIADGETNISDAKVFIENFKKNVSTRILEIKNTYNRGVLLTAQEKYIDANKTFLEAASKAHKLNNAILNEHGNKVKELFDQIDLIEKVITNAPEKNKSNLLGDPLVSYITKKESDTIWKSLYNKTKSWTALGNSDIAVVLREDPESYNNNYTIKGVRVDADKLIQSSFDFLAQSINVLASTQGIAVPADTANNYFAPTVIPAIQNLESEKNKLKNKEEKLKAYKEFMVLEILNRDLDNKSLEDLKVSIEEIKSIWAKYKANLEKI